MCFTQFTQFLVSHLNWLLFSLLYWMCTTSYMGYLNMGHGTAYPELLSHFIISWYFQAWPVILRSSLFYVLLLCSIFLYLLLSFILWACFDYCINFCCQDINGMFEVLIHIAFNFLGFSGQEFCHNSPQLSLSQEFFSICRPKIII